MKEKIINLVSKYGKYILLFFLFFFGFMCSYLSTGMDFYSSYAFSYGLSLGQIPYKEFNTIVPIFSSLVYSTFLFLHRSLITVYLEQAFLMTVMSYFSFKLIGKKTWLFLFITLLPIPFNFYGIYGIGYNFILILLFIILIYLEENNKSDKLIGFVIGLSILTKHSVGVFFIIPSIIKYRKDLKRLFTRIGFMCIPLFLFLIYLIITGSFIDFINLAVLGLFDFSNSNKSKDIFLLIIMGILVIYSLYKFIKNKNYDYLYLFCMSSIVLPVINIYHFSLFLGPFLFIFLKNCKFQINNKFFGMICYSGMFLLLGSFSVLHFKNFDNYKTFFKYSDDITIGGFSLDVVESMEKIEKYLEDKNTIFLSDVIYNYYYKIRNNKKISYYDMLCYGNFGYNGIENMLKKIDNEHDVYFVIQKNYREAFNYEFSQFVMELPEYVEKTMEKVKEINGFAIYYKE